MAFCIYVENNPINFTDPFGLIVGVDDAAAIAALTALTTATAAYLSSPEGQRALNQAADLIQQIKDEAQKKLQNSRCETRVPNGNLPGQKHDPNNKTPDPKEPFWKKLIWIAGKLLQLYSKWPH